MTVEQLPREQSASEFVQRFADAWQQCNADALAALLAEDVVLIQPMMPRATGREAARAAFARLFELMPDLRATVHRWAAQDDVVFIEFTLAGTFAGGEVSWEAVDRFFLRDGLAKERVSYFDSAPLAVEMLKRPRGWGQALRSGLRPRLREKGARAG
jgi:steroid delta-isomerase-like uncharacterized protein